MGLTDKNKENNEEIPEDENNSDRELSIQQRWLDWVKIAPFNALKFTLLWAILGGNVVLLTTSLGSTSLPNKSVIIISVFCLLESIDSFLIDVG